MSKDTRPIEVGDRFETRDKRDEGRVVEVIGALPDERSQDREERAGNLAAVWGMERSEVVTWLTERETFFIIQNEAHPKNPQRVGRVVRASLATLRNRFRRISR